MMVAMGTEVAGGVTDTGSPHLERVSVSTARTVSFALYRVTAVNTKETGRYGRDVDTYKVWLPFLPNSNERGVDRPPETLTLAPLGVDRRVDLYACGAPCRCEPVSICNEEVGRTDPSPRDR